MFDENPLATELLNIQKQRSTSFSLNVSTEELLPKFEQMRSSSVHRR